MRYRPHPCDSLETTGWRSSRVSITKPNISTDDSESEEILYIQWCSAGILDSCCPHGLPVVAIWLHLALCIAIAVETKKQKIP